MAVGSGGNIEGRGQTDGESTRILGHLLHAVMHIASLWAATSPDMAWARKLPSAAARRRIVAQMVRDLLAA